MGTNPWSSGLAAWGWATPRPAPDSAAAAIRVGAAVAQEGKERPQPGLEQQAAAWNYPDAHRAGAAGLEGSLHQAVLATADGLDQVFQFYEKKGGRPVTLTKGKDATGI